MGRRGAQRTDGVPEGRRKRGLSAHLANEVSQEIEALIGPTAVDDLDFEAIETAARATALKLAARAVERRLNEDRSDHSGPTRSCSCGARARFAGRRAKSFQSVLGPLTLERAYFHCSSCCTGSFPRDLALGLEGDLTPGVLRMVAAVGASVSFEEGSSLLRELAGLALATKHVERAAEALGAEIAEDERVHAAPLDSPPAPTLYLGMDGTGVPMCPAELAGRSGKQPDGSAKTREAKLCVVWSAEGRDEKGIPVRDAGSVSYTGAIESAASRDTDRDPPAFVARVLREASRRRFQQAPRRGVLGDGALWIWNVADEHFPGAIQIVDLFHAKQSLSDVGKAVFGAESPDARRWAEARHDELDLGRFDALLGAVRAHAQANDAARLCAEYLERNRHRMRYPEFRAAGLCVSSGVLEAGCKSTVGKRLKRGGMHWSVRGANAILALRCCRLSGRFEDYWERRSARPAA